jgi:hypothetical protein
MSEPWITDEELVKLREELAGPMWKALDAWALGGVGLIELSLRASTDCRSSTSKRGGCPLDGRPKYVNSEWEEVMPYPKSTMIARVPLSMKIEPIKGTKNLFRNLADAEHVISARKRKPIRLSLGICPDRCWSVPFGSETPQPLAYGWIGTAPASSKRCRNCLLPPSRMSRWNWAGRVEVIR